MSIRTLYFIGQCLSIDEHPSFRETIIAQFSDPNYDWNTFIWTCSNHLVLPVIYLKFKKYDLLGHVPGVLAQHLEEIYILNRIRNEQILLQVKGINATLNQAGISPTYMKGVGNLIDGVYSDIGERIIGDIDFLVPEKNLFTAAECFKKDRYVISSPSFAPYEKSKHHHYPRLWKEDVEADIEIHWSPVALKYSTHFTADLVLENRKTAADFEGCFVLSDSHKVILNFIHSQLTNSGHRLGVVSIRDIYDAYLLSKRVDLETILSQSHSRKKAIAYFAILHKLLGLPISGKQTLTSKFFLCKHDLNLASPLFSAINRFPWVILGILHGYLKLIKEAFIYKDAWQSLIRRLKKRSWYVQHYRLIKKNISG